MAEAENRPQAALFYVDPQPLNSNQHGTWRIKPGTAHFCADALGVPVVLGEYADASRFFPLLFAAGPEGGPVALTGVDQQNVFVKDGAWDNMTYVPAYVRRYPFGFVTVMNDGKEELALAIDVACDRFVKEGTEGVALFDGGQPSDLAKEAMAFCNAFVQESQATRAFLDALRAKDVLVERRIDGTLPNGTKFAVEGFLIVDPEKLQKLDDATVGEWHRNGWLSAVYYHLASLNRVGDLIARKALATGQTAAAPAAS